MSSTSSRSSASSRASSTSSRALFPLHRLIALSSVAFIIFVGTSYSLIHDTSLDTSDPLLASLPHPNSAYFAQKTNVFNTLFVKKAWGWTSAAFFALWLTSPQEIQSSKRLARWAAATALWAVFTTWFFGPGLFDRLITYSGGECVIQLPSTPGSPNPFNVVSVPSKFCAVKGYITPDTHPDLFSDPSFVSLLGGAQSLAVSSMRIRPRLYRGHDVSGHIFLLTLSVLFLADQLAPSLPLLFPALAPSSTARGPSIRIGAAHDFAVRATMALVVLWVWMTFTTSVYFHTPLEKLTGFLFGVAGYLLTLIPFSSTPAARAVPSAPRAEEK
ncbi:hypothetical protein BOTBODRAFT_109055 [Botryobasidium botryosum FD-172 SS1]|uniref:Inositol phospholipid synthesis and fat-storage-inducing TM-domain-containing protein n=1 Tax=Botryobasidium botryosum (strain FD-172 SS1) TaxID=930990 RepID=A0A067MTM4_BOTB1|nr:hypothetical protein BOTBODRAFT_109055 [Botryobasidium botryosum FD-172 SS1]